MRISTSSSSTPSLRPRGLALTGPKRHTVRDDVDRALRQPEPVLRQGPRVRRHRDERTAPLRGPAQRCTPTPGVHHGLAAMHREHVRQAEPTRGRTAVDRHRELVAVNDVDAQLAEHAHQIDGAQRIDGTPQRERTPLEAHAFAAAPTTTRDRAPDRPRSPGVRAGAALRRAGSASSRRRPVRRSRSSSRCADPSWLADASQGYRVGFARRSPRLSRSNRRAKDLQWNLIEIQGFKGSKAMHRTSGLCAAPHIGKAMTGPATLCAPVPSASGGVRRRPRRPAGPGAAPRTAMASTNGLDRR